MYDCNAFLKTIKTVSEQQTEMQKVVQPPPLSPILLVVNLADAAVCDKIVFSLNTSEKM